MFIVFSLERPLIGVFFYYYPNSIYPFHFVDILSLHNMALSTSITFSENYACGTWYFLDSTSNYGTGGNAAKADITSTTITLTDSSGNIYTYSDYLPTQNQITLTYNSFTPNDENTTDSVDCSCCDCTETEQVTTFKDGCWSIEYKVYVDDDLVGSYTEQLFFYCIVRNRIFSIIEASCSDCCDMEKQLAIQEARLNYEDMLIVYNKGRGCTCATSVLDRLNKNLDNIENDCFGC